MKDEEVGDSVWFSKVFCSPVRSGANKWLISGIA